MNMDKQTRMFVIGGAAAAVVVLLLILGLGYKGKLPFFRKEAKVTIQGV